MPSDVAAPRSAAARPIAPGPRPSAEQDRPSGGLGLRAPVAAFPVAVIAVVVAWWGLKSGAYFRVTFLPGAMVLLGLAAALLLYAPWPARLRGAARVALIGLAGLAGWTLVSAVWSPSPDVALADATRVALYALAFGVGVWLSLLLGRRMLLALAPLAIGGSAVAVVTLFTLWTGNDPTELLEVDATLRYPLGYRNAVAAFFIAAMFPLLVLGASQDLDWRLRGACAGAASLSLQLAILAQSRGSVFAVILGFGLLLALHPARARVLAWLVLAAIPAALALPWLLDVYQHGAGNTAESLSPLHTACAAMLVATLASAALATAVARSEPSLLAAPSSSRAAGRVLVVAVGVAALAGVVSLALSDEGPFGFVSRHADELTAGTPDLSAQGSRFGLDLRSNRGDLWRVAIDDFAGNPVMGEGAGSFRFSYLLDRNAFEVQPEDPHSVELLMASELGLPGLLLFGAFAVGAVIAVLRARRLGPSAAALGAGAMAIGGYWLGHASVEWFWSYPALTMPMAFALGAAAAPALLRPPELPRIGVRRGLAALAILAAIAMVPLLLSERYTNDALSTWQEDLDEAYSEIESAADLNPLSDRPLVTEAVIAEAAGEPQRALGALSRAQDRVPDEWTLYYLEARVLAEFDPAGAQRALDRARELNPAGAEIIELEENLAEP